MSKAQKALAAISRMGGASREELADICEVEYRQVGAIVSRLKRGGAHITKTRQQRSIVYLIKAPR